jgi:hypothetical protein
MNILMTYLVLISPLTFLLGLWIGKRYGWNKRDNIERLAELKRSQENLTEIRDKWDNLLPKRLNQMEFNVIGIRIEKEKKSLTLEEELELAILNEDYEKAAEIKKKIDNKNE